MNLPNKMDCDGVKPTVKSPAGTNLLDLVVYLSIPWILLNPWKVLDRSETPAVPVLHAITYYWSFTGCKR